MHQRLDKAAPDTVNPSLYRNAQLGMIYGLFKVTTSRFSPGRGRVFTGAQFALTRCIRLSRSSGIWGPMRSRSNQYSANWSSG